MSGAGNILITGASSGLGEQFCRTLAAQVRCHRVNEHSDLGQAILYPCGPDQRFLAGRVLHLDYGQGL